MSKKATKPKLSTREPSSPKAPIRWQGILFAIAANLLLITLIDPLSFLFLTLAASVLAGVATTFYVGSRGGVHAFIGGLLSIPVIGLFILPGNWQLSILTGAFCALGGLLTELFRRRRAA